MCTYGERCVDYMQENLAIENNGQTCRCEERMMKYLGYKNKYWMRIRGLLEVKYYSDNINYMYCVCASIARVRLIQGRNCD